jgi:hypothetical protein
MITKISNEELLGITNRQIKLKIIKMLKMALDKKFEKIAALRDNDVELEKYAIAYSTLDELHTDLIKLKEDKNFPEFESLYMNGSCFASLRKAGLDNSCISDLQFYCKLLDNQLRDSVTYNPVVARVSPDGLEVKAKLCIDGYCYENDGVSERHPIPQAFEAKGSGGLAEASAVNSGMIGCKNER